MLNVLENVLLRGKRAAIWLGEKSIQIVFPHERDFEVCLVVIQIISLEVSADTRVGVISCRIFFCLGLLGLILR